MLLAMAGAALFSGCGDLEPQDTLLFFYDDYLSLTCPEHGTPDYEKDHPCLQKCLSPRAYDDLQRRRDADRDDWLDYDIFIQGQDCWPGIHNTLSVDKLISLYGSQHINISTYQHINISMAGLQQPRQHCRAQACLLLH